LILLSGKDPGLAKNRALIGDFEAGLVTVKEVSRLEGQGEVQGGLQPSLSGGGREGIPPSGCSKPCRGTNREEVASLPGRKTLGSQKPNDRTHMCVFGALKKKQMISGVGVKYEKKYRGSRQHWPTGRQLMSRSGPARASKFIKKRPKGDAGPGSGGF